MEGKRMKKSFIILWASMLLMGCSKINMQNEATDIIIDWVDFIKWEDTQYSALDEAVITDETFIGDKLGEVTFKVNENVSDPHYQTKHGDAAFWDKGTVLYKVRGMPYIIAVEDASEINGYRLYVDDDITNSWNAEQLEQSEVVKVEFFEGDIYPNNINTLKEREKIDQLFDVLGEGEERPDYESDISEGDPDTYYIVFGFGEPLAIKVQLDHDADKWYWYPWELEILPDGIADYVQ